MSTCTKAKGAKGSVQIELEGKEGNLWSFPRKQAEQTEFGVLLIFLRFFESLWYFYEIFEISIES